jgi:hypothetical protein
MAKRRNPKKEKALRNREYARQFRKQTNTGRFSRKQRTETKATDEEEMTSEE